MRTSLLSVVLAGVAALGLPCMAKSGTDHPRWTLSLYSGSGDVDFKDLVGRIEGSYSEFGVAVDRRVMEVGIYIGVGVSSFGTLHWHSRLSGPPPPPPLATNLKTRGIDIHVRGVSPAWRGVRMAATVGHIRFDLDEPSAALATVPGSRVLTEISLLYAVNERFSLGLGRRNTGFETDATVATVQVGW